MYASMSRTGLTNHRLNLYNQYKPVGVQSENEGKAERSETHYFKLIHSRGQFVM